MHTPSIQHKSHNPSAACRPNFSRELICFNFDFRLIDLIFLLSFILPFSLNSCFGYSFVLSSYFIPSVVFHPSSCNGFLSVSSSSILKSSSGLPLDILALPPDHIRSHTLSLPRPTTFSPRQPPASFPPLLPSSSSPDSYIASRQPSYALASSTYSISCFFLSRFTFIALHPPIFIFLFPLHSHAIGIPVVDRQPPQLLLELIPASKRLSLSFFFVLLFFLSSFYILPPTLSTAQQSITYSRQSPPPANQLGSRLQYETPHLSPCSHQLLQLYSQLDVYNGASHHQSTLHFRAVHLHLHPTTAKCSVPAYKASPLSQCRG